MPRRCSRPIVNLLPRVLARRGVTWGELGRRTLLSRGTLTRLRAADANPALTVAERVAAALGVTVERLWRLGPRP